MGGGGLRPVAADRPGAQWTEWVDNHFHNHTPSFNLSIHNHIHNHTQPFNLCIHNTKLKHNLLN